MKLFETQFTTHFRQADPAGILFFNEAFNIFHDAYEQWTFKMGFSGPEWFQNPEWAVPLKKVESEYFKPLYAFKNLKLTLQVSHLGERSFELTSEIFDQQDLCCRLKTVHVFMSKKDFTAVPIPEKMRKALHS